MVDIIEQYKIRRYGKDYHIILITLLVTMIDPVNVWFVILWYNNKQSATIENLVKQTWLCRYPRPKKITYDHRNEFVGNAFKNIWSKMDT